jgi:DNA-binding LacI/PurR family transcriptional regulator
MNSSRSREAAARFAERRKREDEARRLSVEVPSLATLRLAIEERRATVTTAESKHVRLVVVDRAPALFEIPCGDPSCEGGGYDLTERILRELRQNHAEFVVEDSCYGTVGSSRCGRAVKALVTATYK